MFDHILRKKRKRGMGICIINRDFLKQEENKIKMDMVREIWEWGKFLFGHLYMIHFSKFTNLFFGKGF